MPIPIPNKDEAKEDFIKRFMGDEAMKEEYPDDKQRMAVANQQCEKHYEMETVDLVNVPIFSTGTWEGKGSKQGGDEITESTLDSWVNTYNRIGKKVKPRMILGHDGKKSNELTGMASLGWITNLKREGKSLIADIKNIPKKIAGLIEKKALGRFSPGLYSRMNIDGEEYNNVLDHVALLGAQLPANMGLDGFIDMYEQNTEIAKEELVTYENKITKEVNKMAEGIKTFEKEYNEALDKINVALDKHTEYEATIKEKDDKITEYEAKIEETEKDIESLKSENETLKTDIETKEYEKHEAEVDTFLEEAIKEKKILPSQRAFYKTLALDTSKKEYAYIENDKEQKCEGSGFDMVKEIISNSVEFNISEETSKKTDVDKNKAESKGERSYEAKDDELHEKAMELLDKNPDMEYSAALIEVSKDVLA